MAKAIAEYSITELYDGSDALQAVLTNENHTLSADSSGTVSSYSGASTSILIYYGTKDVTSDFTFSKVESGVSGSLSNNKYTVTSVTNGVGGTVEIKATSGSTVISKIFTVSVVKQGAKGEDGDDGQDGSDGKGISSIVDKYLATNSSSGVTTSTSGWTTAIQTISSSKKYLWKYEIITYTDNTTYTSTPVIIGAYGDTGGKGDTGDTGADGKGITSITNYYLASASSSGVTTSTSGWTTTVQTISADKPYLWNYEVIAYTEGANTTTTPCVIGRFGKDGQDGQDGDDGQDGNDGSRGTGIYTVTTAPSSYTTAAGGFTPTYRISLSTALSQSGATEILVGDQLRYSYYLYPVGYVDASYVYCGARVSIRGSTGTAASVCNVTASALVFKSTTGVDGTYTPDYIYLYPTFQTVTYSKWQYSVDGGTTWTNVTSGSNGLTVATYNSIANSLRIANTSDLYTSSVTSVSFKCVSSNTSYYDIVTITKLYDTTDSIIQGTEEPTDPVDGQLWLNTNTNILYRYDAASGDWKGQDTEDIINNSGLSTLIENKNRVFVSEPVPPYSVGDLWIVQEGENAGKIMTCLIAKGSDESFALSDWYNPLTSYTTVTQMSNVIGTDPNEWSTTSKSIKTLINEANDSIAGVSEQVASLAVRSSEIEMSFSVSGTMNFLGNSSGQNNLIDWSLSNNTIFSVVSSATAADVRDRLVSGSSFLLNNDNSSTVYSMTSNNFLPPPGDSYTVSLKVKNGSLYSVLRVSIIEYKDVAGTEVNRTIVLDVPYAQNNTNDFYLEHVSVAKEGTVASMQIKVEKRSAIISTYTSLPTFNYGSHIGTIAKVDTTYSYGMSAYSKVTIITSSNVPTLGPNEVWKCPQNVLNDSGNAYLYIAGFYYENDTSGNLVPITDTYTITMLDQDDYYKRVGTGWTTLSGISADADAHPIAGPIYFGDIMVNGGNMVMTWTPRQDENLWGESIKFNSDGITITNIPTGYKRVLDSSSDVAWKIDNEGTPTECLWLIYENGFFAKDIKCWGTFSMGYAMNNDFIDLRSSFTPVMEMKRSDANDGIDEYIYS